MKRKLTTIFFADGAGYSRLMEQDEAAAYGDLRRAREIMTELFARHDGRQVNSWGDAIIAEFASVVEAVRCAVEVQEALGAEAGPGMAFRIGVNLGDVLVDGEDLLGDGVNVAARLCEIAEPGGVMISSTVHELVRKQLSARFRHVGPSEVKSMKEKVDAWSVQSAAARPARPPRPAPAADAGKPGIVHKTIERADRAYHWVMAQPKKVRRAAGMIFFFFMLNLLFTGIAAPWFVFPSAPFAIFIWLHWRKQAESARTG
ncbi:adenylate/guanylate cyclase domain-containing protein [Rhodovulum sp. DZ06]|uniref:adenylate/guanylate cyclase domain-containing protein n=1 Tax=Rhodovulum sp. DZ06 TaxID=3425126 RepID=UPI003D351AC0